MRQIDDAHQPEDEREATCHEKKQRGEGQPVEKLDGSQHQRASPVCASRIASPQYQSRICSPFQCSTPACRLICSYTFSRYPMRNGCPLMYGWIAIAII